LCPVHAGEIIDSPEPKREKSPLPLVSIAVDPDPRPPSEALASFLAEADRRIRRHVRRHRVEPARGFVTSDTATAVGILRSLRHSPAVAHTFCEWGSGFAQVTGAAEILGFEATGIEIRRSLAEASQKLLRDFELRAEILLGSFFPSDFEIPSDLHLADGPTVLGEGFGAGDEVEAEIHDFDVVYAYPWPDEEDLFLHLFEERAAHGALFVLYRGVREGFKIVRKEASEEDRHC
jgi:hypothetical protein